MEIRGTTQLVGVIGWPVAHSKSPAMHNAAAADLGLDLAYVPLPVKPKNLRVAVRGLPALGFRGVNVTVPHKETVIPLLDEIDPAAQAIGAVNTIVISDQGAVSDGPQPSSTLHTPAPNPHLTGYNTDWSGFMADLTSLDQEFQDGQCLILGGGGSARAVAYGLASTGNQIHIFARREAQGQKLVADLGPNCLAGELKAHRWQALVEERGSFSSACLIVNCTPVGMFPDISASPWPTGLVFPKGAFIYDLVYNPAETMLVKQAKAGGCQAANGLGMLLHQGAQAFHLWTKETPDLGVMAAAMRG